MMPIINKSIEIPMSLLLKVKHWLKAGGVKHFQNIVKEHDRIDAVWMEGSIPHPVHFREGMQVRNFLRDQKECNSWNQDDLDNNWVTVIKKILDKET